MEEDAFAAGAPEPPAARSEWLLRLDTSAVRGLGVDLRNGADTPATIDGYVVGPHDEVTLAIVVEDPASQPAVDAIWRSIEREGIALRRSTHRDPEGRIISVVTLRAGAIGPIGDLLRSALVLPVRQAEGQVEIQVVATPSELEVLERALRALGIAVASSSRTGLEVPELPGALSNEDWAFLGLVQAAGAVDPALPDRRAEVRERVGLDEASFERRLRTVESGLRVLVSSVFDGPVPEGGPERER